MYHNTPLSAGVVNGDRRNVSITIATKTDQSRCDRQLERNNLLQERLAQVLGQTLVHKKRKNTKTCSKLVGRHSNCLHVKGQIAMVIVIENTASDHKLVMLGVSVELVLLCSAVERPGSRPRELCAR